MAFTPQFVLNPDNQPFLDGKSRRTAAMVAAMWFGGFGGAFVAICLLIVVFVGGARLTLWLPFAIDCVDTVGKVIDLRPEGDDEAVQLTYSYEVPTPAGNQAFTRVESIRIEHADRLVKGGPVPVRHRASDPAVSTTLAVDGLARFLCVLFVMVIIGAMPAVFLIGGWRSYRREKRLVSAGQLLAGYVVNCSGELDHDGDYVVTVRYRFQEPDGRELTGQDNQHRQELRNGPLPAEGVTVAVLYLDDQVHTML